MRLRRYFVTRVTCKKIKMKAQFLACARGHLSICVWLQGLLAVDDVLLAVQHGVDAVIVSNHGRLSQSRQRQVEPIQTEAG